MDPRRASQRIGQTDFTNEVSGLLRSSWPAEQPAGAGAPVGTEALTVPANNCLWPQNEFHLQDVWPEAIG